MGKIIIDMPSEPLQEAVEEKVKLDLEQRLGLDHVGMSRIIRSS